MSTIDVSGDRALLALITDYGCEMFRAGCNNGTATPRAGDLLEQIRAAIAHATSDADAFRLAVSLGLTINPYKRGVFVSRNEGEAVIREEWQDDHCETTRRAIDRAAASLPT
jgi:hypothetical protein